MSEWNFADVWERITEEYPERPALAQGDRHISWLEFDRRADGVAAGLLAVGLGRQAKVAQYLYNCPEYIESVFACFKAALVPVNTNFRYGPAELEYLWKTTDVEAVVFHASFTETADAVREQLPAIKAWLWVDDASGTPCPPWAQPYERLAEHPPAGRVVPPWGRSPDDIFMLCTGGTTGMPKGVMWRQDDLFVVLNDNAAPHYDEHGDLDHVIESLRTARRGPNALLPSPPLMHGSGLCTSFGVLASAGSVVLLPSKHYSAEELLDTIERERATVVVIVGDAFAKPIISQLEAHPDRWDLSSMWLMVSSGAMWSASVRDRLTELLPRLKCLDTLGSSEALSLGNSLTSSKSGASTTASFELGPNARVITDDGRDVVPGSGEVGLLSLRGRVPVGYYNDEEKTRATFRVINGERWSVPGDFATVEADGSLRLLGRGSGSINTGGEKVFPEEVEETLKLHPSVHDAAVVGVPDDRFGEAVTAIVEPTRGESTNSDELIEFVKQHLAGYKAPKRVLFVDSMGRAPNGKLDYKRLRANAIDELTAASAD